MPKVDPIPTTPNPEVYRLAAKLINCGSQRFTCTAIYFACKTLKLSDADHAMHLAQYRAAFGPHFYQRISHSEFTGLPFHFGGGICEELYVAHPFWNREKSPERQNYRVLALLFMADILEQGL